MQKGQKLNKQHHRVEFKLPDGFLGSLGGELDGGIPRARIVGATVAGAGAYLLVRALQKTLGDILKELPAILRFLSPLGAFTPGLPEEPLPGPDEELLTLDPAAVSVGLIAGGMVLAGQNPGEILKGIGEIIPG